MCEVKMKRIAIVGLQWGDEGKGKMTDVLAKQADLIVRYQGGDNAGHTVKFETYTYDLHILPSGVIHPHVISILGPGMVINLETFFNEKKPFPHAKIKVSNRAHLILPFHKTLDALKEITQNIGTTKRGIGPSYSDKVNRQGCRVASLLNKERFIKEAYALAQLHEIDFDAKAYYEMYEKDIIALLPNIIDVSKYLDDAIKAKKTIMFEGAQGVMLDISHGTYPYVTSSSPSVSGIPSQVGMAPWLLEGALGIVKAYSTRVGEGPFPTEIHTKLAHQIREVAHEYGVTTGRPRRIGYLDLVSLRHAIRVSGITHLAITLLDLISEMDEIKVCNAYDLDGHIMDEVPAHIDDLSRVKPIYDTLPSFKEDISLITTYENLPEAAKTYLDYIQNQLNVKIAYVSVGPKREQTIQVENIWEASRD